MTIGQHFMCQSWVLDQARKAFIFGFLIALRARESSAWLPVSFATIARKIAAIPLN